VVLSPGSAERNPESEEQPSSAARAILSHENGWPYRKGPMTHPGLEEDFILRRIIARATDRAENFARRGIQLGIGDDAAIFRPKAGYQTILTCDWFLEGTHFLRDRHPARAVGWKCLARAVSDVAAMGGVPRCFLLSLALPVSHTERWLDEFLDGLRRAARKFDCALAGGDTTRRAELLINVTVAGEVRAGRAVLRSGARAGDIIYVSGRLGEAELGLGVLRSGRGSSKAKNPLTRKHLYPVPRLALGQWLADRGLATAMMDLSDGLSSDLPRLCAASGVGARVAGAQLPAARISAAHRKHGIDPLELALHGGDDYELMFTVRPGKVHMLPGSYRGVRLTPIGEITEKPELVLFDVNGRRRELTPGGWDPFRAKRRDRRA
jgi:thiamine-monophosphate kinase